MTHLFLINPAAGSRDRTGEYTRTITELCRSKGISFRILVSEQPGDCTRITREAAKSGEDLRIYACGGDGTLNEVVTGAVGYPNVAVSIFTGGSGNDFVKIFDDPSAFSSLERLLDAEEAKFDLIACNNDYSLNICSVGLDARIGTQIDTYKRLPLLGGMRAYIASTLVNVIRGVSEHYVVEIDGQTVDRNLTMICVCNGRFYGGGFNPVPDADPSDGLLDVLLVDKVSRLKVAMVVGKYKNGKYRSLPQQIHHYRTDRLVIHCDHPNAVNLDGELRMSDRVEIRLAPQKIRFFYPRGLSWKQSLESI